MIDAGLAMIAVGLPLVLVTLVGWPFFEYGLRRGYHENRTE